METQGTSFDKKAVEQLLGGDPGKTAAQVVLASIIVAFIVIGLLAALAARPGIVIVILLCFLVLGWMILQLPAAFLNQRVIFRPAVAAVLAGAITVDWAIQGENGNGIVLVDETGRRLYVNGAVHPFADIKQVEWSTAGEVAYLRIVLRLGEDPVRTIRMPSHRAAAQMGHRLHNAVNTPEILEDNRPLEVHRDPASTRIS